MAWQAPSPVQCRQASHQDWGHQLLTPEPHSRPPTAVLAPSWPLHNPFKLSWVSSLFKLKLPQLLQSIAAFSPQGFPIKEHILPLTWVHTTTYTQSLTVKLLVQTLTVPRSHEPMWILNPITHYLCDTIRWNVERPSDGNPWTLCPRYRDSKNIESTECPQWRKRNLLYLNLSKQLSTTDDYNFTFWFW